MSSMPTTRFQVSRFRTSGRTVTSVAKLMPADWVSGPWQREQNCSTRGAISFDSALSCADESEPQRETNSIAANAVRTSGCRREWTMDAISESTQKIAHFDQGTPPASGHAHPKPAWVARIPLFPLYGGARDETQFTVPNPMLTVPLARVATRRVGGGPGWRSGCSSGSSPSDTGVVAESGAVAAASFTESGLERISEAIRADIAGEQIAGAVALLASAGEIQFFESFGARDREAGLAMTNDAIFALASMTKPITSFAVMMLHEAGHFDLDDPVSTMLPELGSLDVGVEERTAGSEPCTTHGAGRTRHDHP